MLSPIETEWISAEVPLPTAIDDSPTAFAAAPIEIELLELVLIELPNTTESWPQNLGRLLYYLFLLRLNASLYFQLLAP